jgi:tRNA (mo5U34)-methyltransferase
MTERHANTKAGIIAKMRELGEPEPWFQGIDLGDGITTCEPVPHLGRLRSYIEAATPDLAGRSILDIGCNAGYFSVDAKRRGAAHVTGIDMGDAFLSQARFVADTLGFDIDYRKCSVYDIGSLGRRFDIVLCLGVIYHVIDPFTALRAIYETTVDRAVLESVIIDDNENGKPMWEFVFPGYDKTPDGENIMERCYNWWFPNLVGFREVCLKAGFRSVDVMYTAEDRGALLCVK